MSVREASLMMGGVLPAEREENYYKSLSISSVSIDSRKISKGAMFFALKGEKTDGHDYVENAVSGGAVCCVVEKENDQTVKLRKNSSCSFIVVENTLQALQLLSKKYREQFKEIFIIGITGSSGKTTTKELLASILSKEGLTVWNEGNLNSETGLPLSIFRIRKEHRFGVFELGMNHQGEMDILVDILMPDFAVLTNIGTAHIGLLGSRDKIAEEKMKIFHKSGNLKAGIIYENDDYAAEILKKFPSCVTAYGVESQKEEIRAEYKGLSGTLIQLGGESVNFPLIGRHNLLNCLAAVKTAKYLGVSDEKIKLALEEAKPLAGRGEIINGNVTVISDCYNSNRESVKAALDFFDSIPWEGRKAVLLGSILELGSDSERIHSDVIDFAFDSSADAVFFFGNEIEKSFITAGEKSSSGKYVFCTGDPGKMADALSGYLECGDIILLKGSRGMALERFLEPIGKINRKVPNC